MSFFCVNTLTILLMLLFVGCSPDDPSSTPQVASRDTTVKSEIAHFPSFALPQIESSLPTLNGEIIPDTILDELKANTVYIPELQNANLKTQQTLLAKGLSDSDLVSLAVRVDGDYLVALDFTLRTSHKGAATRVKTMLKDYEKTGRRIIELLDERLNTIDATVTDYRHKGNQDLLGSFFEANGDTRLVLFDERRVNVDSLIPSATTLPPGLLERAKRMLAKQKELRDKKEDK
jgi:hypothetical protein